jgi:type I restriction enzyme S subunit
MTSKWQTEKLGDVCRFIDYRGRTPKKTTSGLRLITAKNVKMGHLEETPREFVAPNSYDDWMTRGIPQRGDVLFTTEAPLANVAQLDTDEKVVFAQRIIVLQPWKDNLDRAFLKYLLLSDLVQERIHANGTGATVKGIKARLLKAIPIDFPSLSEQKRIVGVLDEAVEGFARATAKLFSLIAPTPGKTDAWVKLQKFRVGEHRRYNRRITGAETSRGTRRGN